MTDNPQWPRIRQGRPPLPPDQRKQPFMVMLPPALFDRLRAEAKRRDVSMAQVVREALTQYLDPRRRRRGGCG